MEIKEVLLDPNADLTLDEIEMLETELNIGNYDIQYVAECRELIGSLKKAIKNASKGKDTKKNDVKVEFEAKKIILIPRKSLLDNKVIEYSGTDDDRFKKIMSYYRETKDVGRDEDLILSLKSEKLFNEEFIIKNINYFTSAEKEIIFNNLSFKEESLEKNFFAIGGELIARTQLFSEDFYMNFFDYLPYSIVKKSKNEWINAKNRSPKLTVFLRLKGIIS